MRSKNKPSYEGFFLSLFLDNIFIAPIRMLEVINAIYSQIKVKAVALPA